MTIILAVISIVALTLVAWLVSTVSPFRFCAICVGVSGTWIWLLVAQRFGYPVDVLVPAILMGGSVVGIAYQGEKRLPKHRSVLLWKTLFLPLGFFAVYSVFVAWWSLFVLAVLFLIVLALFFFLSSNQIATDRTKVDELEKKMDQCC